MSTLQEVLAVLLGAEAEAKRIVNDSKNESANFLKIEQEKFAGERMNRMASAREQAKGVMETALNAAKAEAQQISDLGKEECAKMQRRFDENVDSVLDSIVTETVNIFLTKGKA